MLSARQITYRRWVDKMSDVNELGLARKILEILNKEPRQTPQSILSRLGVSMSAIRNNLMVLSDLKLVETEARGLYRITPFGQYVLESLLKEQGKPEKKNE
jgi:predicted transcriptional regulator